MLLHTLATQHARTVLVANHEGLAKHAPCAASHEQALAGCVPVPDNAVHAWEAEDSRSALVEAALALARALPAGSLFVVCAGPLSKPLIAALWDAAPRHQYIDFGSAMDETLKGRRTRPYMDADSSYAKGVDPQWFCHRGPAGLAYNGSRPAEADFAEGRCHTFSTPEGE
jgi:predicted DCC family thiol-disulfide oxidoreductase YuxK